MNSLNSATNREQIIIDIKALLWKMLEQWKAIVAFIVIFALVFCSASQLKASLGAKGEEVVRPEELLAGLDEDGQELVLSVLRMNDMIDELNHYIAASPLMSLNANKVNSLSLSWEVRSDNDSDKQFAGLYTSDSVLYDLADSISQVIGSDYPTEFITELIELKTSLDDSQSLVGNSDYFYTTVYLPDDVDAEAVKALVIDKLHSINDQFSASVGTHSINLINESVQVVSSSYVAKTQAANYDRLSRLYSQRKDKLGYFTDQQKKVYEYWINYKEADNDQEQASGRRLYIGKRTVALGVILGFVLYLIVLVLRVVFSGKIQSQSSVEDLFGIRSIDEYYAEKKGSGFLQAILKDGAVVRRHHKGYMDLDKSILSSSETIISDASQNEYSKYLFVVNDNSNDTVKEYCNRLSNALSEAGIQTECAYVNSEKGVSVSEKALMDNDSVVLIADMDNTKLKDIKGVSRKCAYCEVPIAGAVYIG